MKKKTIATPGISFYVAECFEFHSLGEFHDKLTLERAVAIYKAIPSSRMNGIKAIGFTLDDDSLIVNEYDLVIGNRLNIEDMEEFVPNLAAHPLVKQAVKDIRRMMNL